MATTSVIGLQITQTGLYNFSTPFSKDICIFLFCTTYNEEDLINDYEMHPRFYCKECTTSVFCYGYLLTVNSLENIEEFVKVPYFNDLNPSFSNSRTRILSSNCTFDTIVVLVVMFIT